MTAEQMSQYGVKYTSPNNEIFGNYTGVQNGAHTWGASSPQSTGTSYAYSQPTPVATTATSVAAPAMNNGSGVTSSNPSVASSSTRTVRQGAPVQDSSQIVNLGSCTACQKGATGCETGFQCGGF